MPRMIDLTGQVFGWLTVEDRDGTTGSKQVAWRCRCRCGASVRVGSQSLRLSATRSCGCYQASRMQWDGASVRVQQRNKAKHIAWRRRNRLANVARELLANARARALVLGLPCSIGLADIVVPEICPVLGIALTVGLGRRVAGSPTLDRIDNTAGYVPGNVAVISWRANDIKGNATRGELLSVAAYMGRMSSQNKQRGAVVA